MASSLAGMSASAGISSAAASLPAISLFNSSISEAIWKGSPRFVCLLVPALRTRLLKTHARHHDFEFATRFSAELPHASAEQCIRSIPVTILIPRDRGSALLGCLHPLPVGLKKSPALKYRRRRGNGALNFCMV